MAARTRSRLSHTAASGSPTIVNDGIPARRIKINFHVNDTSIETDKSAGMDGGKHFDFQTNYLSLLTIV